ncbi:MAG: ribonuclease H-like domain-containing protein [Deltaproteobacteria bacterium]|nr:ribonuclease H-like domain-containing protein [Deltaproteobacteria bacterium]
MAYATGVDAAAKTRLSEALFFDIETSAHPDGGDFAFLIGAGRFEGTTFVTDQIFCRDPGEEASSLRVLNKMTDACGWVVTFNGRGFDVPFVANRMRAHRLETDLVMRPHVDLLDPSRKLFKGAFKNCRLLTLEREVVGVRRKRDIPSGMIPGRYGEFLAAGDAAMLRETFDHNHYDVATMAGLILGITRLVHDGEPDAARLPGRVAQLVGQWHVRHGNPERAIPFFESVDGENPNARHDALRDLATIFKKAGRLDKAAVCYETMIADQEALDRFDVWPYEELAKLFGTHGK